MAAVAVEHPQPPIAGRPQPERPQPERPQPERQPAARQPAGSPPAAGPPLERPRLRVVAAEERAGRAHPAGVYRRRRAAVAAATAVVVVVLVGGLLPSGAPPALRDAPATGPAITVVVGPGDTLWDALAPHVPAGAHPTAYVLEVAAFNDLDPGAVVPGTVLRLPAVQP